MGVIFLTFAMLAITCLILGLAGCIVWLVERTTWKHVITTFSLVNTIAMLGACAFAFWTTYSWWALAFLPWAFANGLFTGWFVTNSHKPSLNRPIYRVGGGHASPRLHR